MAEEQNEWILEKMHERDAQPDHWSRKCKLSKSKMPLLGNQIATDLQ